MTSKRSPARKLLVASLGVAAVSYVGCGTSSTSTGPGDAGKKSDGGGRADAHMVVGNLAPPPMDASPHRDAKHTDAEGTDAHMVVGNLVAPPIDAAKGTDAQMDAHMIVGNLVAPPIDAAQGKEN